MIHLNSVDAAYTFLRSVFSTDIEEFWVIALNSQKKCLGSRMVSRGTVDHCLVHPRDVFRFACATNASSLLIAHNHPSGDLVPSFEDLELTRRLLAVSRMMEIPIVDHLLLSATDYRSFARQGWVNFPRM